jgi:hypothetical protein
MSGTVIWRCLVRVGDLVRILDVPRGHGLESLIGQIGFVMPTPDFPSSWEYYVNVFVDNRRQVMYRTNIEVINESR